MSECCAIDFGRIYKGCHLNQSDALITMDEYFQRSNTIRKYKVSFDELNWRFGKLNERLELPKRKTNSRIILIINMCSSLIIRFNSPTFWSKPLVMSLPNHMKSAHLPITDLTTKMKISFDRENKFFGNKSFGSFEFKPIHWNSSEESKPSRKLAHFSSFFHCKRKTLSWYCLFKASHDDKFSAYFILDEKVIKL